MKIGIFLLLTLFTLSSWANNYRIHVLKEGETISEILLQNGYWPLYGEDQWVERTLAMNHLESEQDKRIKKGYPIILPDKTKKDQPQIVFTPTSVATTTSTSRYGLLSGLFSDHQEVQFGLDYYSRNIALKSEELNIGENISGSLRILGKNDYVKNRFTYNLNGDLSITSHGVGRFGDNSLRTVNLRPTYALTTSLDVKHGRIPFHFGPMLGFTEQSTIFKQDESFTTQRDRFAWIGFQINKQINYGKNRFHTQVGHIRTAIRSSDQAGDDISIAKTFANASFNITEDYLLGVNIKSEGYQRSETTRDNSAGVNFSYIIK